MLGKIFSFENVIFVTILALIIGAMMLAFTIGWILIVPDLFPGAVEQGLVARSISWWTSFKVAIFLCITRIGSGYKGESEAKWSGARRLAAEIELAEFGKRVRKQAEKRERAEKREKQEKELSA